jgi:hypothetical protein
MRVARVGHIDDHEELIVERVLRREVFRPGRQVGVMTVGKPEVVHAARMRPRRVEIVE